MSLLGDNPFGEQAWKDAGDTRAVRISQYWCRWYTPAERARSLSVGLATGSGGEWLHRSRMGTMRSMSLGQYRATNKKEDFGTLPLATEFNDALEWWHLFHGQPIKLPKEKTTAAPNRRWDSVVFVSDDVPKTSSRRPQKAAPVIKLNLD